MRKIRIGNDIRMIMKIQAGMKDLTTPYQMDDFDQTNIKQIRCYFINTSCFNPKEEDVQPKPFMRVGFPEFYHPTAHNINNVGFPSYHMRPANLCNYDRFEPDFHDFHWWPGYRGFGLHPEHFHDHCCHIQHGPRPKPSCHGFEPWEPFMQEPYDIYGRPVVDFRPIDPFNPVYLADSQPTIEKNTITCFFPAVQQKMCGIYKLVVVLTVYEQGWGRHNLRTYTIDKGNVFELVNDETGESGNITISYDDSGERTNYIKEINANPRLYIMATNSTLNVGSIDSVGSMYNIYVTLTDGTEVLYNPLEWDYNKIIFESENEDLVTVDKFGNLTSYDFEICPDTSDENTENVNTAYAETRVRMKSADAPEQEPYGWFTVRVKKLDSIKIGFSDADEPSLLNVGNLLVCSTNDKYYSVSNVYGNATDSYLWVLSNRKIHYVKSIEPGDEQLSELSSGFRVPMTEQPQPIDGYFYYRSTAPILGGRMNFKIKFV